jgi:hypothetical protein
VNKELSNYRVFLQLHGEAPLSREGPEIVFAESYVLDISGEIVDEVEGGEVEPNIFEVVMDTVGSFSGAKVLAKLARTEGLHIPGGIDFHSLALVEALDELERAGMFKKFYVNIVVLTSMDLEPEHDHLEVRLHAIARILRAVSSDFDLVLVKPVPPQMPESLAWSPEKAADSALAVSFRRLSEDWLLVLGLEGLSFSR